MIVRSFLATTVSKSQTLLTIWCVRIYLLLYMEEKKRSDDLTRQLREEKSRVRALGMGLEEESKRSLAMEAELERHLVQINSQSEELQKYRINAKGHFLSGDKWFFKHQGCKCICGHDLWFLHTTATSPTYST